MKSKQLAVLGIALVAAAGAGYLAFNLSKPEPVVIEQKVEKGPEIAMEEVLVASNDLSVGSKLSGNFRWQDWPRDAVTDGLITRSAEPEAGDELDQWVVRNIIYQGEPIRKSKLLGPGERFMSSMLPSGKRAVAVQISKATSAGGFILPNDFVDLIMTRRTNEPQTTAGPSEGFVTETILRNIRVLAIDQTIVEDEEGNKTIIGETATLELTPQQAEIVTVAQQMADRLSLSLRSIADITEQSTDEADYLVSGNGRRGTVRLIKSGEVTEVGTGQ